MPQTIDYDGGSLVLTPQNEEDTLINIASAARPGTITANAPDISAAGTLIVNGHGAEHIGIDTGSLSYTYVAIYSLGASSYIMARNAPLIVEGASYDKPTIIYADQSSYLNNANQVKATLTNSVFVANGATSPATTTIIDKGGNNIWAGTGMTQMTLANQNLPENTPVLDSHLFGGKETGTFIITENTIHNGNTQQHLSLILDAINQANSTVSPSYTVEKMPVENNENKNQVDTIIYQKPAP